MEQLIIRGRKRLQGEVTVNGAKNAAVAVIPAAILCDNICTIENLPYIDDVISLANTLNDMGVKCEFVDPHTLRIDSRNINNFCATYESVKKIRASYYLLGALLGRYKKAEVAFPGGCNFGTRPIDQHIKGFTALGADVAVEHGMIKASAEKLVGAQIYLDVVSVGATINIMLAAVLAEGTTIIENAAKEPHVVDTANFLNSMGANVKGAGTDVIRIIGVEKLSGTNYMIIPDQIEAGTYMMAGAITRGDVTVKNLIPKHMESLSAKLIEMGVNVEEGDDFIRVSVTNPLKAVNVKTLPYPGFPTDLQPQMSALLSVVEGTSIITESVWDNRFQYIDELKRLGADIKVEGRVAVIKGIKKLSGAQVCATDLRAGAGLVLAALAAEGETTISNLQYIDRGYEAIEKKLGGLGADIKRVKRSK
ncbi:UDP-N-acetylglucosamine 1-carboxyvinyltransferase [Defluviitalea raffinosedens]|uniref:UDP-N-acetylglucosamine 1-carboxyvinyltransferase n=1 Tax=Defluviitalea raffinosedens TaxID=1450156 RepID=A0A7C8HFL9_9FIRM|nr:UDP-N-acetylglucosamine 1-carboxyvinyltransferase [Defluviitalea raffinosedens]KAE9636154.1 UDP-N-acetylglucosamine 1-carboxyvinyltransferase [Defluviitalea raffinosedens]MBM7684994.1 UDP-N-acetylglucosamine 1-carboxyvinyltransferase [Defluviitalea raffinosedens]HHW67541.1 UDP-N-acetylglucosamine 1-carboxyvinyltransferase [Candidatus Epulonipiscium sp.]